MEPHRPEDPPEDSPKEKAAESADQPGALDGQALDSIAERILAEDDESGDSLGEAGSPETGGLSWIRSTLRSGGDSQDDLIGSLFHGKYRILRKVGSGGFGVVYDALDERGAQNRVALKIMRPGLSRSRSSLDMFRGEAVRVTRLHHPNIVDWKNFDRTPDGSFYFVMELLDGEQLSKTLDREGALEWRRAAKLLLQILDGLRAAHFVGEGESILHLDLTPKNILLLPERRSQPETIKVIDFGIGQYLGGDELTPVEPLGDSSGARPMPAEHPGELRSVSSGSQDEVAFRRRAAKYPFKISQACTPEYASPEQCVHMEFADGADCTPSQLDGRADLYSFGMIAYRMLTGRLPFKKPGARGLYLRLHQEAPLDEWGEVEGEVPSSLRRFVERCLEKDPDLRWKDTQEAYEALESLLRPPVWRKLLVGAVALVLLGVALAQFVRGPDSTPFELVDNSAGGSLKRLYLGPESEGHLVQLSERHEGKLDHERRWQLIAQDGLPFEGLSVSAEAVSGVLAISPLPEFLEKHPVRKVWEGLRLQAVDDERVESRNDFEFIWLGKQSWTYELKSAGELLCDSSSAPEKFPLRIDPEGLVLTVHLPDFKPQDIAAGALFFKCDDEALDVTILENPLVPAFECTLRALDPGAHEARISWTDRAGGRVAISLPLEVQTALPKTEFWLRDGADLAVRWDPDRIQGITPGGDAWLDIESAGDLSVTTDLGALRSTLPSGHYRWRCDLKPLLAGSERDVPSTVEVTINDGVHATPTLEINHERTFRFRLVQIHPAKLQLNLLPASTETAQDPTGRLAFDPADPIHFEVLSSGESHQLQLEFRRPGAAPSEDPQLEHVGHPPLTIDLRPLFELDGQIEDGVHEFEVTIFELDTKQARRSEQANTSQAFELRIDSAAPLLVNPRHLAGELPRLLEPQDSIFVESQADSGSPLDLRWSVERDGETVRASSRLALESGRSRWELRPLAALDLGYPDGKYELRLELQDRAGHRSPVESLEFEVARYGPQIDFLSQQSSTRSPGALWNWQGSGLELESIQAEIKDDNGVASAHCRLLQSPRRLEVAESPSPGTRVLAASLPEIPGSRDSSRTWSLAHRAEWSNAEGVYISIEATDSAGRVSHRNRGPFRLPYLQASFTPQLADMWLVPSNTKPYIFGGDDPVKENLRASAGSRPQDWVVPGMGKAGHYREPWALSVPAGQLAAYYLDERKVTAGQFLVFLDDGEEGYQAPTHWLSGRAPTGQRRQQLRNDLQLAHPADPATGVNFDEAWAYASWCHKRLPSQLEMEYAVRGAGLYRQLSWDLESADSPPDLQSPWHRIHDLGQGSEWTCTPQWAPEHKNARGIPNSLLALELPGAERLVAVSHFQILGKLHADFPDSRVHDFRETRSLERRRWDASLGFRCAMSATRAEEWTNPRGLKGEAQAR